MALGQAATIIITVTAILGTLAIVSVGLRIYCRRLQKLPLGADDWVMIVAVILSTGINVLSDYVAATTGVGDPDYIPTMDAVIFALKCNFGAENANIVVICLAKVSILLFYRRIFIQDWFKWCNGILIGLVTTFTLAIMLAIIFSKWPVYDQWNPLVPYNVNNAAVLISFLVINVVFDILTLALPLTALRELQVGIQRKTVLTVIFTLGSFCVVTSILRLYYAIEYIHVVPTAQSLFEVPFIFNMLWANIEQPAFIICGCLLTFGPIYKMIPIRRKCSEYFTSVRSRLRRSDRRSEAGSRSEKDSNSGSSREDIRKTVSVSWVASDGVYDPRAQHGLHLDISQSSLEAQRTTRGESV